MAPIAAHAPSGGEVEKRLARHESLAVAPGEERADVILDAKAAQVATGAVKLAPDGYTVLVPQPSDDPEDPLNWSWRKKHTVLFVVGLTGFLADFTAAGGVPLILPQGEYWHMDPSAVNDANNLNVAFLSVGSLVWAILGSCWGRLPVMLWATVLGAVCVLITATTNSFPVYYAFRTLSGLTLVSYQVLGLASVKDMFFLHEHARKTGIWVAFFIVSPYLSPLFANFILAGTGGNSPFAGDWRAVLYLIFGIVCFDLVLIVLFGEETFYNRAIPVAHQPAHGSRLARLTGVWHLRTRGYSPSLGTATTRLFALLARPIVLPTLIYYMLVFMWAIGINQASAILFATPPPAGYGYSPRSVGYLYFTPIVGALLGEVFGHFFNDFIANRYVQRHAGRFQPEARLPATYFAAALMIPGLVAVGQGLHFHLSVGVVIVGWGMYIFGLMTASVAISTYLLDSFLHRPTEVSGLINFFRSIGGFQVPYYQAQWGAEIGYNQSFGIQAALVGFASLIVVGLHLVGPYLRRKESSHDLPPT